MSEIKNKFFLIIIFTLLPIFLFANHTINLDILENQQNAIANIQYDTNISSNDKGSPAITQRGNYEQAMLSLEQVINKAKSNPYLYNQFVISLGLLQVSNNHVEEAQQTFKALGNIDSFNNPMLQVYLAAYSLIWTPQDFSKNIATIKQSKWPEMTHYISAINLAKSNFDLKVNTKLDQLTDLKDNNLAIVVLGYGLNDDGSIKDTLADRLKVALVAYHKYPNAMIIVSGGAACGGVTESYQMKQWLIKHKISTDKIILEDQSISTVTNAINTIGLIKRLNRPIQDILLVTSDPHIRRANYIFEQEIANNKMSLKIYNLASITKNYASDKPANMQEKILIIKDTLRTAGLWQMPGMVF
ncbi:DUF218 domain-containing protein [Allofrancisella inopinata]|uniref:YdcF family protein n=1 Tax=Allofrancisella inopinata TaxID=1085647 RepID=A0AAE7CRW5_9GAMM|nr:YdcF family protein [Allofrancisella inopinata]QIV96123.1 YdcF family protein [Allofrancisella inopinata]TDT66980.1 DUF218 domain-containing protein [Allofrancisella inopinata]